jgi:flavin reductase (DIM6/NTAB) family NADH-FMN oxidoreductase RutF
VTSSTRREVLSDQFRQVMAHVATPVAVVTTADNGRPHGTTVSAFMSLSLDPPIVLVALDCKSELLSTVRTTRTFGINVLTSDQIECALAFAGKGGVAKFDGVDWALDGDLPRLAKARTWLACDRVELLARGDHVMMLGHVVDAESSASSPLVYHTRTFGTHVALDDVVRRS